MIPLCLIIGDSTGVGTAAALAEQGIRCEVHARVGASSSDVARTWRGSPPAAHALLAIGSNDPMNPALARNLMAVRRRTAAARVTWLLPYNPSAARVVATVAASFGDQVVPLSFQPTADQIHPRSYGSVAVSLGWKDVADFRKLVSVPPSGVAPLPPTLAVRRRATVLIMQ